MTAGLALYVGEDSGGVASEESGVGLDIANTWEHAIRQALMPVTPKSSVQLGEFHISSNLYILLTNHWIIASR